MQFLAKRTRCITNLIYFPFVALAFGPFAEPIVRRLRDALDNRNNAGAECLPGYCVCGFIAAGRRKRPDCRPRAFEGSNHCREGNEDLHQRAARLEMLLEQVDGLNEGAFAPLSSQPLVKAVLLPLITYGGTLLVHMYALPGS